MSLHGIEARLGLEQPGTIGEAVRSHTHLYSVAAVCAKKAFLISGMALLQVPVKILRTSIAQPCVRLAHPLAPVRFPFLCGVAIRDRA